MQTRRFSMIEIVLAIGVVAVGMVSVLALFPIGLQATRDAMAEGASAQLADSSLQCLRMQAKRDWPGYVSGPAPAIPASMPAGSVVPLESMPVVSNTLGTLLDNPTAQGRFTALRYQDMDGDGTRAPHEPIDFRACVRIWREPVTINGTPLGYEYAARLMCRLEWPEQLPRARRQSSTFCLELFAP